MPVEAAGVVVGAGVVDGAMRAARPPELEVVVVAGRPDDALEVLGGLAGRGGLAELGGVDAWLAWLPCEEVEALGAGAGRGCSVIVIVRSETALIDMPES